MKHYTAKQVALEVLKKAEECLNKSELLKKEPKAKVPEKTDLAYEVKSGKSKGEDRVKDQVAPEKNPKENKEKEGTQNTGVTDAQDQRLKKGESKHDRCAEKVKENSPEVKNPHAVCVAEGVKPAAWKKSESVGKLAKFMEDHKAKLSKVEKNG